MYSLEASLMEQARRRKPTLDITAHKKPLSPGVSLVSSREYERGISSKKLDGIVQNEKTFLEKVQHRSWRENMVRSFRLGELYTRRLKRLSGRLIPDLAPRKMLYGSIMGGIAFGMISMAFMEHYFGPGVFARSEAIAPVVETASSAPVSPAVPAMIENYDPNQDVFFEYFGQVTKEKYEVSIRDMVKGYPIETMLPYIFAQDRLTAAFLVGIAKKESNWGKRVPVLEGQDCFNYWGYRGVRRMMGSDGHTCFNSREDAVETVSTRLQKLIQSEKLDTPEKMIVWKCGFSCEGHSRESVKKWISDVDMYFSQLSDE